MGLAPGLPLAWRVARLGTCAYDLTSPSTTRERSDFNTGWAERQLPIHAGPWPHHVISSRWRWPAGTRTAAAGTHWYWRSGAMRRHFMRCFPASA
jgi:hypothetical protein